MNAEYITIWGVADLAPASVSAADANSTKINSILSQ
jgi:hypothetical protein